MVKKTILWLLGVVLALYFVSGLGITQFRTVEALTFGLLTKNIAFRIHSSLWIPFAGLLILYLLLPFISRGSRD